MSDEWRNSCDFEDVLNMSKSVDNSILSNLMRQVQQVLIDHPFITAVCPRVKESTVISDTSCPFYIKAPLFRNCSLIANFFGPFTAKEVAYMMNTSIDAIYHIEKSAMQKLRWHFTTKDRKDLLS